VEPAGRSRATQPAGQPRAPVEEMPPFEIAPIQQPAGAVPEAVPEAAPRQLSPEERVFMDALTKLFTTAQEFGLTLASIETDTANLPPDIKEVVEQGREVARAVKNFQRIIKKRMGLS